MQILFLSHGSPTFALEDHPVVRFWQQLPERIGTRPRAVLCVSAHWDTEAPTLSGDLDRPSIQHDFHGFPDALYRLNWSVAGGVTEVAEVIDVLSDADLGVCRETARPFDHGVWVPLRAAWLKMEIPTLQLSLCTRRGSDWHWRLGQALAPLCDRGWLLVGSGGLVHNLGRLNWREPGAGPDPWAADFMNGFEAALRDEDSAAIRSPWTLPEGRSAVPTPEHYLPFVVCAGAAGGRQPQTWFAGWNYGCLGGHAYAWDRSS